MNQIEGFITDQINNDEIGEYTIFHTYGKMMTKYSHYDELDPKTYKDPQLYVKALPSFNEVFELFMSYGLFSIHNKTEDVCLSLFYNPYFNEFYDRIKNSIKDFPKNRVRILAKNLLEYLADPIQYKIIVELNTFDKSTIRNYYIEKDIFNKSKELLQLINEDI